MKIVIATDHNGVNEKKEIINNLKDTYEVIDMSVNNHSTDDYPEFAFKVAEYIKDNPSFDEECQNYFTTAEKEYFKFNNQ